MKITPVTTVIGSFPVDIDSQRMMHQYFTNKETNWQDYIKKAVDAMVHTGVCMVSDGQTRDPFTTIFLRRIGGIRLRNRPEVLEPLYYEHPITVSDYAFVKSILPQTHQIVACLAGPFTLMKSCVDHVYQDEEELAFAFAHILNKEALALQNIVDMISVDEPFYSIETPVYMKELLDCVMAQVKVPTRLHVCGDVSRIVPKLLESPLDVLSHEFKATPDLFTAFEQYSCSKKICLGSVRSDAIQIEPVEEIVSHIRRAQEVFGDKIVQIAPDCGQRLLPSEVACKKLQNLVQAWRIVYAG